MAKSIKMGNCYPPSQDEEDYYEEYDSEEYEDNEEVKEELLGQKAKAKSIIVKVKKVQSGVNDELSMKIDIDVELSWLMMRYRDKLGMHKSDYKFMFNGVHVRQTDTPRGLSMRDNDIIYVFPTSMHRDAPPWTPSRNENYYRTLCIRMPKRRDPCEGNFCRSITAAA
ncbi:hypothetical protein RND81_06G215700 [Saponaria officinalis]|uniref:Ubiquitin-like domain-containing protein n=1 Tax=Saponaria officinalis TaxID=3572 RepID=A0AAW1K952_SAPOF